MNNYNPSTHILNPSVNGTQHIQQIEVEDSNAKNNSDYDDSTGEVFICVLFFFIAVMIFGYMLAHLVNYLKKGVGE